jgi:hypothetical protein
MDKKNHQTTKKHGRMAPSSILAVHLQALVGRIRILRSTLSDEDDTYFVEALTSALAAPKPPQLSSSQSGIAHAKKVWRVSSVASFQNDRPRFSTESSFESISALLCSTEWQHAKQRCGRSVEPSEGTGLEVSRESSTRGMQGEFQMLEVCPLDNLDIDLWGGDDSGNDGLPTQWFDEDNEGDGTKPAIRKTAHKRTLAIRCPADSDPELGS